MNETNASTAGERASSVPVASVQTYRSALALAFFTCFLWMLFVSSGWFAELPLPPELSFMVGLFTPLLATTAILYPTVLFRARRPALRMVMLFSFGFVLLIVAFILLAAFGVILFAFGIISPE